MEVTLAWQGCEGQRDTLFGGVPLGPVSALKERLPVIMLMVGPFLLQAVLGEGWARSQLWVRRGCCFPSHGTRVRPAQQHRVPPHSGLGTCFQGRHLGGISPHRSEDSVHMSPEGHRLRAQDPSRRASPVLAETFHI